MRFRDIGLKAIHSYLRLFNTLLPVAFVSFTADGVDVGRFGVAASYFALASLIGTAGIPRIALAQGQRLTSQLYRRAVQWHILIGVLVFIICSVFADLPTSTTVLGLIWVLAATRFRITEAEEILKQKFNTLFRLELCTTALAITSMGIAIYFNVKSFPLLLALLSAQHIPHSFHRWPKALRIENEKPVELRRMLLQSAAFGFPVLAYWPFMQLTVVHAERTLGLLVARDLTLFIFAVNVCMIGPQQFTNLLLGRSGRTKNGENNKAILWIYWMAMCGVVIGSVAGAMLILNWGVNKYAFLENYVGVSRAGTWLCAVVAVKLPSQLLSGYFLVRLESPFPLIFSTFVGAASTPIMLYIFKPEEITEYASLLLWAHVVALLASIAVVGVYSIKSKVVPPLTGVGR